jgi:four helix bundle protein
MGNRGNKENKTYIEKLSNVGLDDNIVADSESSYNAGKDFTTLQAWRKARKVKLFFYNSVLQKLPEQEKYGLNTQIRRSAVSTTANIAEGYGRYHYQEGIQFYRISRGSLYELKDHLISCLDLTFISKNKFEEGAQLIEEAKITLNGYIRYVKRQKNKS